MACDQSQSETAGMFKAHALKGEREPLFSEVFSGLDRHRSPCWSLRAKPMFDALAMVAYNWLEAIELLESPEGCPGWRCKTLLRKMGVLPVRLGRRGRVRTVLPWVCGDRPIALSSDL